MADPIVASSIRHIPHLAAFDQVAAERFANLDTSPVLVYSVATVPAAVLLYLAQQFDLMGPGGWDLATTEDARRELIRGAIELHRRKGTVWAVKESIRRIGYPDVTIIEHVSLDGVLYDGQYTYDGSQNYGGGFWADFRVKITVPDSAPLSNTDRAKIVAMVNEYKNVRSRLVDVTFVLVFGETVAILEDFSINQDPLGTPDFMTGGLYYDGGGTYNGAANYDKGSDPMELKIYQNSVLISTETL